MRRVIAVISLTILSISAFADDKSATWEALVDKDVPLIVATAATGPVAKAHPYNPNTFGKVRGLFPAGRVGKTSIMVYTNKLDEQCIALIRKLDEVATEAKAEGSFVHIFDLKGAQAGGYTAEEVTARIKELEKVAKDNKLTNISLGISASPHAASEAGLDDTHQIAVVVVKKSVERNGQVKVKWYKVIETNMLDGKIVDAVANNASVELKK